MSDLARALEFWHGRLGLPVKLRAEGYAELQSETLLLALAEGGGAPGDSQTLAWEVKDLSAARAELDARGIACEDIVTPCTDAGTARGRRVGFRDPDGHRLELVSWN